MSIFDNPFIAPKEEDSARISSESGGYSSKDFGFESAFSKAENKANLDKINNSTQNGSSKESGGSKRSGGSSKRRKVLIDYSEKNVDGGVEKTYVYAEGNEQEIAQQRELYDLQKKGYNIDNIYFNTQGQGFSIAPAVVQRESIFEGTEGTIFQDSRGEKFSANPDSVPVSIDSKPFGFSTITYASGRQELVQTGVEIFNTPVNEEVITRDNSSKTFYDVIGLGSVARKVESAYEDVNKGVSDLFFPYTSSVGRRVLNPARELDDFYNYVSNRENSRIPAVMDLDSNTYKIGRVNTFFDVDVVGGIAESSTDYVMERPIDVASVYTGGYVFGKTVASIPYAVNVVSSPLVKYGVGTLYAGSLVVSLSESPSDYQEIIGREVVNLPVMIAGFNSGVNSKPFKFPVFSITESNTNLKRFGVYDYAEKLLREGKVSKISYVSKDVMGGDFAGSYNPVTKEIKILKGLKNVGATRIDNDLIDFYRITQGEDISSLKGLKIKSGNRATLGHELVHAEGGREFEAFLWESKGNYVFVDPTITKPSKNLNIDFKSLHEIFSPKIERVELVKSISGSRSFGKNVYVLGDNPESFVVGSEFSQSSGAGLFKYGDRFFKLSFVESGKSIDVSDSVKSLFSSGKLKVQEFKYSDFRVTKSRAEGFIDSARALVGLPPSPSSSSGVLRAVRGRPMSFDINSGGSLFSVGDKKYLNVISKFTGSKNTFFRLTAGEIKSSNDFYSFFGESIDSDLFNIIPSSKNFVASSGSLVFSYPEESVFGLSQRSVYNNVNFGVSKSSMFDYSLSKKSRGIPDSISAFNRNEFVNSANSLFSEKVFAKFGSGVIAGNIPSDLLIGSYSKVSYSKLESPSLFVAPISNSRVVSNSVLNRVDSRSVESYSLVNYNSNLRSFVPELSVNKFLFGSEPISKQSSRYRSGGRSRFKYAYDGIQSPLYEQERYSKIKQSQRQNFDVISKQSVKQSQRYRSVFTPFPIVTPVIPFKQGFIPFGSKFRGVFDSFKFKPSMSSRRSSIRLVIPASLPEVFKYEAKTGLEAGLGKKDRRSRRIFEGQLFGLGNMGDTIKVGL